MIYFYVSDIFFKLFILLLVLGFILTFIFIFRQKRLSFFKTFLCVCFWACLSFLCLLVSYYFYLLSK